MSRRPTSEIELDMFPFLSVLCAVIGILMLFMIIIISTRTTDEAEEESFVTPSSSTDTNESDSEGPGIEKEQYAALDQEILLLTSRLTQRIREYRDLSRSYHELEDAIGEREMGGLPQIGPPPTPVGTPVPVIPVLDGEAKVTKTPICIEVKAGIFMVHPEKTEYTVQQLEQPNSPFRKFIRGVDENRSTKYFLLLLHPNGVETHRKLRKYLLKHHNRTFKKDIWSITVSRIDIGVEPFSRDWLLIPKQETDK